MQIRDDPEQSNDVAQAQPSKIPWQWYEAMAYENARIKAKGSNPARIINWNTVVSITQEARGRADGEESRPKKKAKTRAKAKPQVEVVSDDEEDELESPEPAPKRRQQPKRGAAAKAAQKEAPPKHPKVTLRMPGS